MKRFVTLLLALCLALALPLTSFAQGNNYNVQLKNGKRTTVEGYPMTSEAREILRLVNQERRAAGVPALTWDASLARSATQRAAEISIQQSHTRPNGREWHTVSNLAFGENLVAGMADPETAMEQWMSSSTHRRNILNSRFTTMGVGVLETDEGEYQYYWVQLFGTGQTQSDAKFDDDFDSDVRDTDKTATKTDTKTTTKTPAKTTVTTKKSTTPAKVTTTKQLDTTQMVNQVKTAAAKAGNQISVTSRNAEGISGETLKAMSAAAGGKELTFVADTLTANGKAVEGRLYLSPAKLANWDGIFKLGVTTQSTVAQRVAKSFDTWFKNETAVYDIEQSGSLAANTRVTVLLPEELRKASDLRLYSYNPETNVYVPMENTRHAVDSIGFLTFYTSNGGPVVISQGPLARK